MTQTSVEPIRRTKNIVYLLRRLTTFLVSIMNDVPIHRFLMIYPLVPIMMIQDRSSE